MPETVPRKPSYPCGLQTGLEPTLAGLGLGHREGISERQNGRGLYLRPCTPHPFRTPPSFSSNAVVRDSLADERLGVILGRVPEGCQRLEGRRMIRSEGSVRNPCGREWNAV